MISTWRMVEVTGPDGTPLLTAPREPNQPFDVEKDGSPLLRKMQERLEESGWADERGMALFAELAAQEMAAQPVQDDATDWLQEVGPGEPDDWSEYEFDPDSDWKGARW